MAKVVYNACYGGFSLSPEAVRRARALSGNPTWGDADEEYGFIYDVPRHDPVLVQVVEELGEKANGSSADLRIKDIGTSLYRITDYDGCEFVETPDYIDWNNPLA